MRIGMVEFMIIGVIIFVLFGATLIPKLFKAGKNSVNVLKDEIDKATEEMNQEKEGKEGEVSET